MYEPLWQESQRVVLTAAVVHRVGDETRRRIGVAVAALDAGYRNMRRRRHAGRGGAVVTARAIGVGRLVDDTCRQPSWRRSRLRWRGR